MSDPPLLPLPKHLCSLAALTSPEQEPLPAPPARPLARPPAAPACCRPEPVWRLERILEGLQVGIEPAHGLGHRLRLGIPAGGQPWAATSGYASDGEMRAGAVRLPPQAAAVPDERASRAGLRCSQEEEGILPAGQWAHAHIPRLQVVVLIAAVGE